MKAEVAFERLEREPLHERVYRQLRSAIIAARFEPGRKLTVRSISSAFGVSTMPVRAAFTRLVAEKAVAAQANGTIIIPIITKTQFDELIELRIYLEGLAAIKAAGRISLEELVELQRFAAKLREAAETNDADAYLQLNQNFKFALFRAARSPALEDLIERIWLQIGPFMRHYASDVRGQIDTDQYSAVIDALRRGDADAAREAMEKDIVAGARFIEQVASFAAAVAEDL